MRGDTIELFMWGFQRTFRSAVEMALQKSLEVLGVAVEPTVFLIGLLKEGGSGHSLCVEPEDGPIVPADFDGLRDRVTELFDQDPDSKLWISTAWIHERRQQEARHRAYGTAISEVLEARLGPGLRFFAGLPTLVDQHIVFTAVGFPERVLDDTPHLSFKVAADRYPVTQSLVRGAVDEVLRLSSRALYEPYAGADIDIGADPADVAKAAGSALTRSATVLAGNQMGSGLFDGLNRVATTRYERRVGIGSLLLADARSEHVDRSVTLQAPVPISETRTLRKLLETSSRHGESLLTDGSVAYALGRQRADYPSASESVFQLLVIGDGVWELHHASVPLATVQFGAPRLPEQRLRRERLDDIANRVFRECDSDALWALAAAAADAEHGTMLVVSERAAAEAARLGSQALTVEPTRLDDSLVRRVTGIDGAVLVDPSGRCHAIGVILDGTATGEGDRSRGARYNSAVKYLASAGDTPTVILLVSEDGMINLLPDLRPRMRRADLDAMLAELREAATIEPVHPEKFYRAYRQVEAAAFYLSPDQIEEVNTLRDDHWERRMAEGANIRVIEAPLRPNPEMTDEYLIDLPPASPPSEPRRRDPAGFRKPYRLPATVRSQQRYPASSSINEPCPARWKMISKADRRKKTVHFALGGAEYEIDLSKKNARAFRKQLALFIEHAHKAGRGSPRPVRTMSGRARSSAIRAWTKDQDIPVSDRGCIPENAVTRYQAATSGLSGRPETTLPSASAGRPSMRRR